MAMTRREKGIAIAAAAVVGLLAGDYFILSPFLEHRSQLAMQRQQLQAELDDAKQTKLASQAAARKWRQYKQAGLQTDASATENNLLNEIRKLSAESRLTLVSLRPDRASTEKGLVEMSFQATAQGNMRAMSSFIYKIETTTLPIRIREVQIASRTDATDDLTMQMRISTLWEDVAATRQVASADR